ncbi:hypothetical protein QSJ18_04950 [Gordonia sp. ABSL1-1]|uniref:hypothetical protein n=1 Tax=Gordonia sp. ABSL1-1 TaxID=3053923 RepID=UPI0025735F7F|nr:hypothetical protein [Gordonia sp. ABSL1-1]MDL9936080.1 hypothetical protein [Gordonia sp. ABSL1-1]
MNRPNALGTLLILWCAVLSAVTATLTGCSAPPAPSGLSAGIVREPLGPDMRAYRQEDLKPVALMVWFHGMDSDGTEFEFDPRQKHFAEPFLRSGWIVVSASAGGNSFGNDAAMATYRTLVDNAHARYGAALPTLFASESMGSVAAIRLAAEPRYAPRAGVVGVSPLTGIPDTLRSVDFIAGAWDGPVPARADPLSYAPNRFAHHRFRFYYSPADTVVPTGANARAFAIRVGKFADVGIVECRGDHADPTCYQGEDALTFARRGLLPPQAG